MEQITSKKQVINLEKQQLKDRINMDISNFIFYNF
jgi:hypothetical protein